MSKQEKNGFHIGLWGWLAALLPAVLGTALYFISAASRSFSDWYALNLYPVWVGSVGRFFGIFPFSANELGIYILIALGLFWLVRDIARVVSRRLRKGWGRRWLWIVISFAGSMWLVFMLGCGINYNRTNFAEANGLPTAGGTKEELYQLCEILTEETNRLAFSVQRDENGIMQLTVDTQREAVKAMGNLADDYPPLSGFYPQPKPVFFSEFMSHENISGVHSPFTSEAQYNRLITPYNIPHTVCHELSHLKGYMREDEANFVGYLACINSESGEFQYSGYVLGYIYATNALYGADRDKWSAVRGKLDAIVNTDLAENSRYWDQYRTVIAEVKEKMNDSYLKFNHQEDGVKSYGRVVDLMLAYYHDEIQRRLGAAN